jgi:hypothetical protein
MLPESDRRHTMALRIEIHRDYLEKALELAIGSSTRASNQKGLNPMIRELHQKDAKIYTDAKIGITDVK